MRLLWRVFGIILSIIVFLMILDWIGFDMQHFSELWNTMLRCFHDVMRETKGILKQ